MESFEEIAENQMLGKRIGVYKLVREIGRGGMGAVYLAERVDGEFRQTVAIKLIKRGMDTDLILKRFRRERQIVASLDHPNIAYFLGGGSTEDGLPYFVMEYIEGKPLYQFCRDNKLSIKERLEIFRQVCDAVEAAHRNKIIHRDLKPSNILVKADGTPKLLDFGIAKALHPDLSDTEIDPTATAMRVMTPEYASPEQISGEDVNSSSDIYSLGIVLYEMLTGHRPYILKRQAPHEVAKVICEEMPVPPSARKTDEQSKIDELKYISNAKNTSAIEVRNKNPQNLQSNDLDKIVLKTLRKDPAERYASAAEFAKDITNYLEDRPVIAEKFPTGEIPIKRSDKKSVAILPFKVIGADSSKDTDDIFVGIGLADALVSRLSGVQRLIVRPTSSVLPFAEENPVKAGRKIGVDFILCGTIRHVGERIRISVQLLNVLEDSASWAEKFDEKFTDVLELEDSISEKVAKVLLPQLTGEERRRLEKRGTNNPQAYQAYLRGRYFANQFTDESLTKAVEAYHEAVGFDPDYALAHVGIADYYVWSSIFGMIPSYEAYLQAKESAQHALQVNNSLGEAYAILAFITLLYEWDWAEAERLVKRALELNPNFYFAHECYSNFFSSQGIFDESINQITLAEELDPLSPRSKLMTAWTLYLARDFSASVAKAEQANEMQTEFPQGLLHLGNALTQNGQSTRAVKVLQKSTNLWKDSGMPKYMLCFALVANGQTEEAQKVLNEFKEFAESNYVKPYFLAMSYAALGELDAALGWFEKAIEGRDEWMIWFGTDPKLDALRKDKRYSEILERTNNPIFAKQTRQIAEAPTTARKQRSIAVLPFRFLGTEQTNNAEHEYLGIGLADALTMRLSNMRRFLVRPTSSVLAFGEKEVDPFAAGRELGVEFIVEGNIRRIGDKIRVAAQLLEVKEHSTHWANHFDEKITDVLALEDSISERVTKCLLPKLTGEERRKLAKRGTNDPKAFEAYMRGRYFWNQFMPETYEKAFVAFNKAIELDPNYALAYVGIADFYSWGAIYGLFPPTISHPKVFEAISRALEIDDTLSEAYATLGIYHSNNWNWEESEKNHKRAMELNPNYSLSHEWLAATLIATGRFEKGVKEIRLAETLDPLSIRTKVLTAWTTFQAGYYEESLAKSREIVALDPQLPLGYFELGIVLLELGEIEEALECSKKFFDLMPQSPLPTYFRCFALTAAGRIKEAEKLARKLETRAEKRYIPPYFRAMSFLAVNEFDKAFHYFEKALDERSPWCTWFGTEPRIEPVRNDQRYIELYKRMNIPAVSKL